MRNNTDLIQQIKNVFDEVEKPANHFGIFTANAQDDYREPTKQEKRWDRELERYDLTPKQMHTCDTALIFLEPEGFHYYLPAYMILAINEESIKNKALRASVVFDAADNALSLTGDKELQMYFEKRHQLLNKEQAKAVIQFLQYRCQGKQWNEKFYNTIIAYWEKRVAKLQ